jgi:hypothetical protein
VRSSFDGPKGVFYGVEAPSLWLSRPRSYTNFPSTSQPTNRGTKNETLCHEQGDGNFIDYNRTKFVTPLHVRAVKVS